MQQLRSFQIQLSNLVCACSDDEDFIPQLLPPPPSVRRRQVTQTPSPSACLQNISASDQQTQHVPPTQKIASKAMPFDPSSAIYVARIPPNALDDLGSMFQAFGRIRRVIPMSSETAIVVFFTRFEARSALLGPLPPGFETMRVAPCTPRQTRPGRGGMNSPSVPVPPPSRRSPPQVDITTIQHNWTVTSH